MRSGAARHTVAGFAMIDKVALGTGSGVCEGGVRNEECDQRRGRLVPLWHTMSPVMSGYNDAFATTIAQVVGEGFVRQGSVMSAVPVLGSTTVGGGVCGTSSGRPRGPRQGEGLAAAQMPDYTPTQGRQIVGKSKCCKVDTRPLRHQQSAAGSATAVTPKRTAGSPVLPSPGAKRLRHARDSSESEASTDASLDFGEFL
jgi:hypothetical protein